MSGLFLLGGIYLLAVLVVAGLLAVPVATLTYNRLVSLKATAEATWSDIDASLAKRYNLLANLAELVKGYAGHEQGAFRDVAALRSRAAQAASPEEKARIDESYHGLARALLAVAESYPELKADRQFRQMQGTLQELEAGIETSRRGYNDAVRRYNTRVASFPANLVSRRFGFAPRAFFECRSEEERQLQSVHL